MIRAYFNQRAGIWDEAIAEKDAVKLSRMVKWLKINPGSVVLDVGTGTGVFLPFLIGEVGTEGWIIALDFAEKMLRKAQAKCFEGNITYLHADVINIPLSDNIVDAVVCYSSFPHFPDKPTALAEMKRVIKKGGRLFICHTSGREQINAIHHQQPALKSDLLPGGDEMRRLLSAAGFIDIEVKDTADSYLACARKPSRKA
jgi:ubiquinone/menaquinone biosynthesis C-methylase UbiE